METKNEEAELRPEHFMHERNEASKEGVRGLFIINGGGAVALLAFLQAIWVDNQALSKYVVVSIAIFGFGVLIAGVANFLRYHASWNYQGYNIPRFMKFRRSYITCWYISLTCFAVAITVIIWGAWCLLNVSC